MKEIENLYKYQIAQDLILFLLSVQLDGLSPEIKRERTTKILAAWKHRVDTFIQTEHDACIKNHAKANNIDVDVATILSNVHQVEPSIIRNEFVTEISDSFLKSLKV